MHNTNAEQTAQAQHSPAKGAGNKHSDIHFFWTKEGIKLGCKINPKVLLSYNSCSNTPFISKGCISDQKRFFTKNNSRYHSGVKTERMTVFKKPSYPLSFQLQFLALHTVWKLLLPAIPCRHHNTSTGKYSLLH